MSSPAAGTRDIARLMFLSEHTVQDHLKSIFAKTATRTRRTLLASVPRHPAADRAACQGCPVKPARLASMGRTRPARERTHHDA
jgi:hypothetical protein